MHEVRNIEQEHIEGGSNKSFGIVFFVVFMIVSLWPVFWGGELRLWALIIAAIFLVLAFFIPNSLSAFNKGWTKFGLLLNKIVSPVFMGLVFFGVVTPMALAMRLLRKRSLELKYSKEPSYWIERKPAGPEPESFNNQF